MENQEEVQESMNESVPTPRKRGRPPKVRTEGEKPELPGAEPVDEKPEAPKKRGRKPKSKGMGEEEIGALARQIQGIHSLAAMMTGLPELNINEFQAGMLAQSVARVSEEFGLAVTGKTGAILSLVATAAMVYAPKAMQIAERVKQEKARKAMSELQEVMP